MNVRTLRHALLPALILAASLSACDAKAEHANAGAFDGRREFKMVFKGDAMCAFKGLPLVTKVRGGHADGLYTEPNYGGWTYSATVADSGRFQIILGGYAIVRLRGALSGDNGKGDIEVTGTSLNCSGDWTAKKLPEVN